MTVIYARTSLPHRCGCSRKSMKNMLRVKPKYINCGAPCGVVLIKNRPMSPIADLIPDPTLKLSTNKMVFIPKGETKILGIQSNSSWIIV